VTAPDPEPHYLGARAASPGDSALDPVTRGERPVFAWLHRAAFECETGVGLVIVPPFGYEAVCAHRALRHLAITAAEAGVVTVRVDLDGTGDSAGDDLDPDRVARWIASIGLAADLARARGATRIVIAGVRLGALLGAVAAGARADVAGLVAIAPVVTGKRWLREMKALQQALGLPPAPEGRELPPADAGVQEVIGFAVTPATQAALGAIELDKLAAPPAPSVLVIDRDDLPASDRWIAHLRGQGADVDARRMHGYVEMVLDPHKAEVPVAIVAAVVEYARARPAIADVAPAPAAPTASRLDGGRFVEEPVLIDGALAAIATRPAGAAPARALVLLNAGCVRRIGPNRLNVALARRLAAEGTLVVRVDLSGIGDSPARPGTEERLVYFDHALADVAAILAWCRERGAPRAYVSGLCSGGYYALRSPAAGEPWAGAIIVNPGEPGTGIDDKPYESAAEAARYKSSLRSLASWKRLVRGDVDVARLARIVRTRALERVGARARDALRRVGIPIPGDVGSELVQLARRGVATTFVFCDREPGLVLFRERVGSTGPRLEARGALSVRVVDGPDHTYTPRWSHPVLLAEVAAALARGPA
jgi:pimeloyl-ACP methyl ester carboxylesterase